MVLEARMVVKSYKIENGPKFYLVQILVGCQAHHNPVPKNDLNPRVFKID